MPNTAPRCHIADQNTRDNTVIPAAILVGQHGQVEEGLERGGHACYQDRDGTRADMLQGFCTGHGLSKSIFASKIFTKPNNSVLLGLKHGLNTDQGKTSAAETSL